MISFDTPTPPPPTPTPCPPGQSLVDIGGSGSICWENTPAPLSTPHGTATPYACSVALPAGWGAETPSAYWMLTCGHCVSALSGGATSTPYACPDGYTRVGADCIPYTPEAGGEFTVTYNSTNGWEGWDTANSLSTWGSLSGGVWLSASDGTDETLLIVSPASWQYADVDSVVISYQIGASGTAPYGQHRVQYGDTGDWTDLEYLSLTAGSYTVDVDPPTGARLLIDIEVPEPWYSSVTQVVVHGVGDIGQATATPAATVPAGFDKFCENVEPAEVYNSTDSLTDFSDFSGWLSADFFTLGSPQCVGSAADTVTIGAFGYSDVEWPGFTICFIPVTFADINFFGRSIPIDTYIATIASFVLIKWFWGVK